MSSRYQEGLKKTKELQDLREEEEEQKSESPEEAEEVEGSEEEEKDHRRRLEACRDPWLASVEMAHSSPHHLIAQSPWRCQARVAWVQARTSSQRSQENTYIGGVWGMGGVQRGEEIPRSQNS